MSMYRTLGRVPVNDVYAVKTPQSAQAAPAVATAPARAGTVDRLAEERMWSSKRRSQPVNIALPRTRAWADSLPARIHLTALMSTYPRIANMLAATWNDQAAASAYLDELMVDRRGNRRGFPSDVLAELSELRIYFANLAPVDARNAWRDLDKRK